MYQRGFSLMKKKNILVIGMICIAFLIVSSTISIACSGFTIRKDGTVLIAHNKDWWSPDTYIHVYPSTEDAYGRLFLEIPYPHIFNNEYMVLAGGFNEHGLCYESYVTPFNLASFEFFKPPLFKSPVDHILQTCTTVEEVISYIESHNLFFVNYILCSGQIFVIDRLGDAAIIEGDDIIRINGEYQVCTNFLQSAPELGNYPCWRYDLLTHALQNITEPSIPLFESLLESVELFTQYSWIFNPSEDILHLYHFHNYTHSISLNLTEEFSKPAHTYYLPELFEPLENTAPLKPSKPLGPINGDIKTEYLFETQTTDADNPQSELYYQWDFGDGSEPYWIYSNGEYNASRIHAWKKPGTYQIRVKARDIYGKESPWSDGLTITITRISAHNYNLTSLFLFQKFID